MPNRQQITRSTLISLIIITGILVLTILLSFRSWYKPTIKLSEISPLTISIEKDIKVPDYILTQEKREAIRKLVLQNIDGMETLKEDREATRLSINNLNFLITVAREAISGKRTISHLIDSKISRNTQEKLLALSDKDYLAFRILIQRNRQKALESYSFRELKKLASIEFDIYLKQIENYREEKKRAAIERDYLGNIFFERLRKNNPEKIFNSAQDLQKKLLSLGIVLGTPKAKITKNIRILDPNLNSEEIALISKLLERSTLANIKINWKRVDEIENQAMASVPQVFTELKSGQILAFKGERVAAREYYLLKELGLLHPKTDWKQIFSNFYWVSACILLLTLLLKLTKIRRFMVQEVHLFFIVTTVIIAVADLISLWGTDKLPLTPLATISIILSVFYAPYVAGISVTLISIFFMSSFDLNLWQILPMLVGSIYAITIARNVHQREDLSLAGLKIAVVQMMVFGLTLLIAVHQFKVMNALSVALMHALSGWASGFIALAVLPYLESALGLLTPFKLSELANPNQPLLRLLRELAPGTYEHSLRVSRLSEEASNRLGANTALIRTGLLYHDIGKTYKPGYFIENLFGKPNPHTTLDDPEESARIIIAHVPEGIKLAHKHHLPQAIIDFIPMHQGTTITNYFYAKALDRYGKSSVNKNNYRYPGPKPNSRETGIAMMADSVEAALKSMTDLRDEAAVKTIIDKIIQARLDEGELNDTGLSNTELEKISEAFLSAWRAMNHERIKYPDKIGGTS